MHNVGASQPPELGNDGILCIIEIMQYYPMHYYRVNCMYVGPRQGFRGIAVERITFQNVFSGLEPFLRSENARIVMIMRIEY